MSSPLSSSSIDRLLARSVLGTVLICAGGLIILVGSLYGVAVGLTDLLTPPPAGPTPAGSSHLPGFIGAILLAGAVIIALGGQLVVYAR